MCTFYENNVYHTQLSNCPITYAGHVTYFLIFVGTVHNSLLLYIKYRVIFDFVALTVDYASMASKQCPYTHIKCGCPGDKEVTLDDMCKIDWYQITKKKHNEAHSLGCSLLQLTQWWQNASDTGLLINRSSAFTSNHIRGCFGVMCLIVIKSLNPLQTLKSFAPMSIIIAILLPPDHKHLDCNM